MEKFLFILREKGINRSKNNPDDGQVMLPDLEEWIGSLKKMGNYYSGIPVGSSGKNVTGNKMSEDQSLSKDNDPILRFDIIMAENFDHAVSIAQTNPLVIQGIAETEVRSILTLVR